MICGFMREKVKWAQWKMHNIKLNNLCTSPKIIMMITQREWEGWASSTYRVEETCIQVSCRKPEGKTALERARCRWDDIKGDLN
jgi:hypothetical protein